MGNVVKFGIDVNSYDTCIKYYDFSIFKVTGPLNLNVIISDYLGLDFTDVILLCIF